MQIRHVPRTVLTAVSRPQARHATGNMLKEAGRKSLDSILKLELLEKASPAAIMNLWTTHHQLVMQYWGRVISTEAFEVIAPRLKECPYFVVPVFRDKGMFNVVTNFQAGRGADAGRDDLMLCCPLGEWQAKQDHASIHMTIQFFTELSKSKGIVLVRCELMDQHMTKQDAMFVTHILLKYYTLPHLFNHVELFNKSPNQFSYHNYLRQMKEEAKVETGKGKNIEILDEKRTWEAAYGKPVPQPSNA
ncbi:ATP synthase mitochondrial F1 complex assembly factor 1 [Diplonema papillatum]|nr:ATP synthase mitochondrial F1 complex assembly factor 1 [Diplonema papillatum]